jgi:hypothetical protein
LSAAPGFNRRRIAIVTEQTLAVMRARNKAYRWPKGTSGNPDGQSQCYHICRKLAREAGPEMMLGLIDLAKNAEDERVRSVCLIAVLDRAGVRPIDKPEPESADRPAFDPRAYSAEDLAVIEAALKLMLQGGSAPAEAEVIPASAR